MTPDEFRAKYPKGSIATHDANGRPLRGPALGPDGIVYAGEPGEEPVVLSSVPDPYLDGITEKEVAREIRGAVYKAKEALQRALDSGDGPGLDAARNRLADLLRRAQEEGVEL